MGNKGLTVTLIILLSIMIFALVLFLVLALNGKLNFNGGIMSMGSKSENVIVDKTYDLKEIDYIDVLSNAGNIEFKENTDDNIRIVVYGKNENDVKIEQNSNKLKIDYSYHKKVVFGFNFEVNDIILYIPSSFAGKINIDNDYGESQLCDLENASINLDSDCGSVRLGKVKNADIKCDMGDVKVDTILNKCNIKANCGNIKIMSLQIKENSEIKCDLGDVKIEKADNVFIDAKVDLGNTKIKDNNRQADVTLSVEVDCGNIKVGE